MNPKRRLLYVESLPTKELRQEARAHLDHFLASGLRYDPYLHCICHLHFRRRHERNACQKMPFRDHVEGFRNPETGERILVHHPYYHRCVRENCDADCDADCNDDKGIANITKLSETFALANGLVAQISDKSWYYPTKTLIVQYRVNTEFKSDGN